MSSSITTGNISAGILFISRPDSQADHDTAAGGSGGAGGGRGGDVYIGSQQYSAHLIPPADLVVAKTTVFDRLEPHFVRNALYDSRKREEEKATVCQEGTRTRILEKIRQWADGAEHPVCWLSGPAGTGKTTIAHTIAEEYSIKKRLAATFFFWRKTGDRDDINRLWL
jgi:hypothetical protein